MPRPRGRANASDISWRHVDWVLAFAVLALCVIGSLLIASATRQYQLDHHLDQYAYLKKHLLTVGIGAVLAILVARSDFRLVRAYTPIVYLASLAGLVAVLAVGSTINGARSWIVLPAGLSAAAVRARQARARRRSRADPRAAARRGSHRRAGHPGRPGTAAGAGAWPPCRWPLVMLQPDFGTTMVLIVMVVGRAGGVGRTGALGERCSSRQASASAPPS